MGEGARPAPKPIPSPDRVPNPNPNPNPYPNSLAVQEYKVYFKGEISSGAELPNVHTIMKRHGSWEKSCAAAGLRSRPDAEATRARKEWGFGSPTFSEVELLTAVEAYAADQASAGRKVTVLGYHDWAVTKSREGRRIPLSGAIRTRLIGPGKRFGSWPGLISHVRAPDAVAP